MKKIVIKYLLVIGTLPLILTGCYTQLATQDDSYSTFSNQSYDDYEYENAQVSKGGYFDESDTLDYYYEGEDSSDYEDEIVINNYYGYNPYYPQDDYYSYYPTVSVLFGFGFGYGYSYYYPWYTGWYHPYYPGHYYLYPPYYYFPTYYYSYYPYYGHGGYYGGHYSGYYNPHYKTRSGYVTRLRNSGNRGYSNRRRDLLRNPTLVSDNAGRNT
ncbi:MAG: hypothetical protein IH819_04455, partial [Bacteroidetes bacterium]|nr:hypothetical protein [Bacteroidota bacterium]